MIKKYEDLQLVFPNKCDWKQTQFEPSKELHKNGCERIQINFLMHTISLYPTNLQIAQNKGKPDCKKQKTILLTHPAIK